MWKTPLYALALLAFAPEGSKHLMRMRPFSPRRAVCFAPLPRSFAAFFFNTAARVYRLCD